MLILLSPAKTLNESTVDTGCKSSESQFSSQTKELVTCLQSLGQNALQETLRISQKLASLNYARYKGWSQQDSKPAGFAFDGPAYKSLDLPSFEQPELLHCQQHLRILDGLYGVLKPLDAIKPYRLEMSNKLETSKGKSLYVYWRALLTEALKSELHEAAPDSRFLVNCASQEYFKAIDTAQLDYPVYTMHFPGPSLHAKAARGAMVRYIVKNRVASPPQLQSFTGLANEWRFDAKQSTEFRYSFVRCKTQSKDAGSVDKSKAESRVTKKAVTDEAARQSRRGVKRKA